MCHRFNILCGCSIFYFVVLMLHKSDSAPTEIVTQNGVYIVEVPYGENVILKCRSNDKHHNFDYWVVEDKEIVIGPSNGNYDLGKFKYEILSGNLTVKAVSKNEEGTYTCISRGVNGNNIKMDKVKMIVMQDWEEIYEHDSGINTIRIVIILITFVLLAAGGYVVYRIWRDRYRYPSYLEQDEEDDDSAEEIFSAPSTSGINRASKTPIVLERNRHEDDFETISTDFKSILDAANSE